MTTNTDTLKYITINGQTDVGFALSVRKAQAGKYATSLTKKALCGLWYAYASFGDDCIEGKAKYMLEYNAYYGISEDYETEVIPERNRDAMGMFVSN